MKGGAKVYELIKEAVKFVMNALITLKIHLL